MTNYRQSKWLPSDPTPVQWYSADRFENLVASYVAAEQTGARACTVREFVSEFRGLSGTAKQKQVVAQAKLDRAYLHDLLHQDRQIHRAALEWLLNAMRQVSAPVKPDVLGTLGEMLFGKILASADYAATFRYKRVTGTTQQDLPYIVECAFTMTDDPLHAGAHIGLNWGVPLSNPLQESRFDSGEQSDWGLGALLARNRIDLDDDPICLALHLTCPDFRFLDRGKAKISLPTEFARSVARAVLDVTKDWAAIKKKQERDQLQATRMAERYRRASRVRITVKQAKLKIGHPLDDSTDISSLINEQEAIRVEDWIEEAVHKGARRLTGGPRRFATVPPSIFAGAPPDVKISCQEVFGPVVNIVPYRDFEEAITLANDSDYGLQAGIFTTNIHRAFSAAHKLQVGGVIINDVSAFRADHMPYGGVKDSGNGREGPRYAIEEMTELKLICWKV